jgi:ATP-dependent Lon protease
VRGLEKWIEKLSRSTAMKIASNKIKSRKIDSKDLVKELGQPFFTNTPPTKHRAGIVTGLAWTAMGGEALTVEAVALNGKDGALKLTGQMGNVMMESANLAWTYVKKFLDKPEHKEFYEKNTVHMHIPAGAVPKDGPSAGITMAACLYSLVLGKSLKPGVAMTGELTLSGEVLPVGGIKEKIMAAQRAKYKLVILPKANERDLKEVPASARKGLKFKLVSHVNEVFKAGF